MQLDSRDDRHVHVRYDQVVVVRPGGAQLGQRVAAIFYFFNEPLSPGEVPAKRESDCGLIFDKEGAEFPSPCRVLRYAVVQKPESAEPSGDSRSFSNARSLI